LGESPVVCGVAAYVEASSSTQEYPGHDRTQNQNSADGEYPGELAVLRWTLVIVHVSDLDAL
jgi:hypothetical protein